MKKGLIVLSLTAIMLGGCGIFNGIAIDDAIETIDLDEPIESAPELPESIDNVDIEWTSSDKSVLHPEGFYNPPTHRRDAVTVTLEATFTHAFSEREKTYEVTVLPAQEPLLGDKETIPFEDVADEFDLEDTSIDIRRPEDGEKPYVEFHETLDLLEGAIRTDDITINDDEESITLTYGVEDPEEGDEESYDITFDFAANDIHLSRFDLLDAIAEETETDFGEGLSVTDYEETLDEGVRIDLDDYRFHLIEDEGHYLPLSIANLFLSGGMFDLYYQGDTIYGVDTYQISGGEIPGMTPSPYEGDALPESIARDTINHLALTFDYFYGLKADLGIEDYYTYLEDFIPELLSSETHDEALHEFTLSKDDPHTSYISSSHYTDFTPPQLTLDDLGERTRAFNEAMIALDNHCRAMPDSEIQGSTGFIRLSSFDEDTPDLVEDALETFTEEDVTDVVIDLTCNTGGVMGSAFRIMGYMSDEPIRFHNAHVDGHLKSTTTYTSEAEAYDFDFFIATSQVTYSAANYLAASAQEEGIATIVGAPTQGGAASITSNITPSGAILLMSSRSLMSDSDYQSLEMGIAPDISVPQNDLKDPDALIEAIEHSE